MDNKRTVFSKIFEELREEWTMEPILETFKLKKRDVKKGGGFIGKGNLVLTPHFSLSFSEGL